jgi:hypothetical protein
MDEVTYEVWVGGKRMSQNIQGPEWAETIRDNLSRNFPKSTVEIYKVTREKFV